jgi:uncharacterized repeat protein (TIGR01451 family)
MGVPRTEEKSTGVAPVIHCFVERGVLLLGKRWDGVRQKWCPLLYGLGEPFDRGTRANPVVDARHVKSRKPLSQIVDARSGGPTRWRGIAVTAAAMVLGFGTLLAATTPANASAPDTGQITISPTTPTPEPAGGSTTYSIDVECSSTGFSLPCGGTGGASTITIPLVGTNTVPADMSTWAYSATSGTAGLIAGGPTVEPNGTGGFNLVLTLSDSVFVAGDNSTITLQVTPPDNITPNNTTWTLLPTLTGGNIASAAAPTAASGEATAAPLPVITKITADGGNVYIAGSDVTYDITAHCNAGNNGNLYMTRGSLTDPLPAGMSYVSSTPAGGAYDPGTNTVTWAFPNEASTPVGCASGAAGATNYQIVATTPDPAPSTQPLTNIATFAGQGPDAVNGTVSGSTDAEVDIDVVNTAPTGVCTGTGCPTIAKSSLAPLAIASLPGNQYEGTYAGSWVPTSSTPTYTVGAASGSYQVDLKFPLTDTYETQVVDPLPCLTAPSGGTYSSGSATGPACSDPAFDATVIEVSGPGLNQAITDGWIPTGTEDGTSTTENLTLGSTRTNAAYYSVPGGIADINLPPTADLDGNAITLTLWGFADPSLSGGDVLANTATATPILISDDTALGPITASANLFIEPSQPQLGISKTFGAVGGGPGGTTLLHLEGAVNFPGALNNNVVLADLLPAGLSWSNTSTDASSFTLTQGSGASSTTATGATVAYQTNYEGTGQDLIRVTIPSGDFTSSGDWTIAPPPNFFELVTPTVLGTYANTDQIFLYGIGLASPINPACTTPTQTNGGTTPATFESDNPDNLAGDGETQEDYCQNSATLVVEPTGAAFSLTKTVQGNTDVTDSVPPKGALGIGDATLGGYGVYGLNWSNVGSDTLNDAVIYDILPHVGDTGVSQAQSGSDRNSQFAPAFDTVLGTLPSGVTVMYSEAANPCRTQVYPNAQNAGCVDDWSATDPSPAAVTALEFVSTNSYLAGQGFSVSFQVTMPTDPADANLVAWNSAATDGSDVSNPASTLLPAEPPKVGLTAPTGGPAMTTASSGASSMAYSTTPIDDTVTIVGTGGNGGTLNWSLVGPVPPVAGSCDGLDWTGATAIPANTGSTPTPGADGQVKVGPATVQAQGCYSWTESLTLDNAGGTASVGAGDEDAELVQATPYQTALATAATPAFNGTDNTATDSVTVTHSGLGSGNGAPTSATLSWNLYGPVTPVTAGSCAGVTWGGAATDSGTLTVTGDGLYTTPSTNLTAAGVGCYTYTDSLPQTGSGIAVASAQGVSSETFILVTPPAVDTIANQDTPNPRTSVSDAATITGTFGNAGTIAWQLVGPVTPPTPDDCTSVTGGQWTTAAVTPYAQGTQAFSGNQTALTVPSGGTAVGGVGCYSWAETVTGPNFLGPMTVGAGTAGEFFQVVPYQPTFSTTAVPHFGGTTNTASDAVTISNSDLGAGASASLTWTLYGPVTPSGPGSCTGVTQGAWLAAGTTNGSISAVNGSGNHTQAATLTGVGCYSYTDSLAASTNGDTQAVATTLPGVAAETFVLLASQQVTSTADQATPDPRATVSDSVTISGTSGFAGSLAWQLVGPVTPPTPGDCTSVTTGQWTTAAVTPYAQGTKAVTGDQTNLTVPTAGTTAGAPGCYSWAETLTGANFLGPTTVAAGTSPTEILSVQTLQPAVTTTMATAVTGGVERATDSVVVGATNIEPGNTTGAPTSGSVIWTLDGPVTPVPSGGCGAVTPLEWSSAPQAAAGTITVTGNGSYSTIPGVPATSLTLGSCYSYADTLSATTDSAAVTVAAGTATETTEVPAAAAVTTTANQSTPDPRTSVSDSVTITGTGGGAGSIAWSLIGPFTPVPSGGCSQVTGGEWAGTATYASGSRAFTADQTDLTVPTAGTTVGAPGCYTWSEVVSGSTFPGSTTLAAGDTTAPDDEVFEVQALQPTLTTTINSSVAAGVESATDSITVAGTDIAPGNTTGAPTSGTINWSLYGPVAPVAGSCTAVTWPGAAVASGAITIPVSPSTNPNTTYTTPSTVLTLGNCYSYAETLVATTDSAAYVAPVGVVAETAQVPGAPDVTTVSSSSVAFPHASVSDSVTISGIGTYSGSLAWTLVGPVNPASDGTCNGISWTGAATVGAGTTPISAAGTVTSGPETVPAVGCYSWTDSLTGTFPGTTTINAGAANEVVLVRLHQPMLTTTAAVTSGRGGTKNVVDAITLSGSGIGTSLASPQSAGLDWTLSGPVTPASGGCASVSWAGAATVATGSITVTGDGPYSTPSSDLTTTGCYSYSESLAQTTDGAGAGSADGGTNETVLLLAPPTVATTTSSTLAHPYSSLSDSVDVSGTSGQPGTLDWSMVGPVTPASDGTCNGVSWSGAPTGDSGTTAVNSDGTVTTGPTVVKSVGCYSFADTFTGADFLGQAAVPAGAANEVTLVQDFDPALITAATLSDGTYFDTITVSGSGIGMAPGAPTSAVLTWTLLGPATGDGSDCAAVTWAGQPTMASGTMTVTGDGTYTTPSTSLGVPGCYTFYEQLNGTAQAVPASTQPGVVVETAYVPAAGAAGPLGTTPPPASAPDGLGSIGTDLGRWLPGNQAEATALAGVLALIFVGAIGSLVLVRRRRRRS